MNRFELVSKYQPTGDQPKAIKAILENMAGEDKYRTLLGVTGSGKTFTMANIIQGLQKPALVIAHNKTLTAQLAQEFKEFFPNNAVHYFVSYYDYYQPEAFVVKTGTYIEKEATINEEIDRLRHAATESLLTRKDVIIVASVSCIYGIGEVEAYENQVLKMKKWEKYAYERTLEQLVMLQFRRSTTDFRQGMFRVRGDTLEIFPSSSESVLVLDFFGDELDRISRKNFFTNEVQEYLDEVSIFPAKHFVTSKDVIEDVVPKIKHELEERLKFFHSQWDLIKAERLKTKVEYDIEMMMETGYVNGIENYSMYLSNRSPGMAPSTLLEFFPDGFLTFIDESHMTIPQIGGMYAGDRARKMNLIDNGFRLPSAFENRPLQFQEFESKIGKTVFVSATPGNFEKEHSSLVVEQIIRPTGLLDPIIELEDMEYMVDSLLKNIQMVKDRNERALITTLTKKSSEELSEYLAENGIKVKYLHSEIETIERLEILRDLRMGKIEVIVWVNLLREGLDLPEVSFIGILDAEKVGFLRSTSALLQIIGRAARNVNGKVIMYSQAKKISLAMQDAMDTTNRRREIQHAYNVAHGITPQTIISSVKELGLKGKKDAFDIVEGENIEAKIKRLELEMDIASANLDFEEAATLRDAIIGLRKKGGMKG